MEISTKKMVTPNASNGRCMAMGLPVRGPCRPPRRAPPAFRPRAPRASSLGPTRRTPSPSGLLPPRAGHQGAWQTRHRMAMGLPVRGPCRPPRRAPARFPPSRAPGLLARLGTPHAVAIGPSASARGTPRCVAPGSQLSGPACARRPALAGLPRSTPRPVVTRSRASRTSTTRPLRVPGPRLRRLGRGDRRRLCLRQRLRQVCAATCPSLLSPALLGLARARARGCICTCVSARAHVCACLGAPFSLEHHARSFSPMICPPLNIVSLLLPFSFSPVGGWPPGRP